ncbi:Inositol 1,4,5-trisphosphate receptor type 3 [Geodia barretti]|uniref:Inositol 1,4,5-trisphosphate receptor n=1 Tax=Geodia barretti TaxID=519541 RepID=A0AA35SCD4_GEOBA|nr:Inositol 1,4,5-trisphosphate receptor type 3 [Geodia barretti]
MNHTLAFIISPILFLSLSPSLADSLFKIVPMHRYSAQEQFRKATATARSMPDVVILQKLQAAADQERSRSDEETTKQMGTPVLYHNTVIQLVHVKSNKYLTVQKRLPALVERRAMRISLDNQGSEVSTLLSALHFPRRLASIHLIHSIFKGPGP